MDHKTFHTARQEQRERLSRGAMLWLLIVAMIVALLAILSRGAFAAERNDPRVWDTLDTSLQVVFLTTLAVDRAQTIYAVNHKPPLDAYTLDAHYEEGGLAKSFIGRNPDHGQINRYFAGAAVLHTAVSYALPKPYRTIWQSIWIGAELATINRNISAGVSVRFD